MHSNQEQPLSSRNTVELELDREQAEIAGIKNLPKVLVLWELWRHAKPDMTVFGTEPKINSVIDLLGQVKDRSSTSSNFNEFFTFVWLDRRNLSCTLSGDFVDLVLYNTNNEISGVLLINKLKEKISNLCSQANLTVDQASFIYLEQTKDEIYPKVTRRPKPKGMQLLDQILFNE
jgi:hypothetical protein